MTQPGVQELFDQALVHHQAGEFQQAEEIYRQLLRLHPDHAEAMHHMGVIAHRTGRSLLAADFIRRSISLQPNSAEARINLGAILREMGQTDEAIDLIRQGIALDPRLPEAYITLGAALREKGQLDEAIKACRQAIALDPRLPQAHNSLANALTERGDFDQAIASYRQAIALRPASHEIRSNLGGALREKGLWDEAIVACRHAIQLCPAYPRAYGNLGNALRENGDIEEAIAAYRRAIALLPDFAEAHGNLGNALRDVGLLDEAIAAYRRQIALQSESPHAHWNLSHALLLRGDYSAGWEEYEWRWRVRDFPSPRRGFTQPHWDGSELRGRTLLLHAEQGIGDTLMVIRYLPLATQRGGRVILECQPELARLLRANAREWEVIGKEEPLPDFDLHLPLMSLPKIFSTTVQTIPPPGSYLHPDPADQQKWRERLGGNPDQLTIGLAWAGNRNFKGERSRSPGDLSILAPLGGIPGVRFISLQKGDAATQTRHPPAGMNLLDFTAEIDDFADTAALIANLDLVITSDTSIPHLAGAMGKPTWMMLQFNPDWRWLMQREDSPWYSTLRLFRQPKRGDWQSVINRIAAELKKLAGR